MLEKAFVTYLTYDPGRLTLGYQRCQRRALAPERKREGGRPDSLSIQSGGGTRYILEAISAWTYLSKGGLRRMVCLYATVTSI